MCLLAEDESCISFQSRDTFFRVFDVVFHRKNKKLVYELAYIYFTRMQKCPFPVRDTFFCVFDINVHRKNEKLVSEQVYTYFTCMQKGNP